MDEIYFHDLYTDYGITANGITYTRKKGIFKLKNQATDNCGYKIIQFLWNKKFVNKRVHVFLWECYYHDLYPFSVHIRPIHKDGNKLNNTIDNLKMYINTDPLRKKIIRNEKMIVKKNVEKPLKIMEILPASYANFFFSLNETGRDHLYKKIKNRTEMMKPWEVEDIFRDELRFFRTRR